MANFPIRPAISSEKEALEALQLRASLANAGDRDAILAHPDAIEVPAGQIAAGRVFVAESNGAIAGFAAIEPRPDGETELDGLFVEPSFQRRGIGRRLVEHCAEATRRNGATALHVIGNPHARDFYLECGFEQIGTTSTRFGVAQLYRKML